MSNKKIIAGGCSFTAGAGLNEFLGDNFHHARWPEIVAEKLGLDCQNLGVGASSNKRILYSLLTANIQPGDIVLVMWSGPARTTWMHPEVITPENPRGFVNLGPWHVTFVEGWGWEVEGKAKQLNPDLPNIYYGEYYTDLIGDFDLALCMHHLKCHVATIGASLYNFSFLKDNDVEVDEVVATSNMYMEDLGIQNTILTSFEEISDYPQSTCFHPGPEAHRAFAERILRDYIVGFG